MKRVYPVAAAGLLGALLFGAAYFREASVSQAAVSPPVGPAATHGLPPRPGLVPSLELQGVASCAAASCHGANDFNPKKGSEYSIWVASDPHRKAYRVLSDPRSVRMQEILIKAGLATAGQPANANPVCLKCHALGGHALPVQDPCRLPALVSDGVTCEGCHGPAQLWLTRHYKADWPTLSPAAKQELGFVDLKNLTVRAWTCTECHVGGPDQEVNHVLLAGGHPALRFELAGYHANLPKHWDEPKPGGDFEVRLWSLGQLVSADAAVRLLSYRAHQAADGRSIEWPELTEYDCFACHHDLQPGSSWRQSKRHIQGRRIGSIPYSSWYVGRLEPDSLSPAGKFLADLAGPDAQRAQMDLAALRKLMTVSRPNAAQTAARARETAQALSAWTERVEDVLCNRGLSRERVQAVTAALDADIARNESGANYDQAVQFYLALAAFQRNLPPSPALRERLLELKQSLLFPAGYDSPKNFVPAPLTPSSGSPK
jgi:hypothetical protein